jgi:hypothetical protein
MGRAAAVVAHAHVKAAVATRGRARVILSSAPSQNDFYAALAELAAAEPAGRENIWAAACLARARGRLHGDRAALEEAVSGWQAIGARFERACTLCLLPDRRDEGTAELAALACRPPVVSL